MLSRPNRSKDTLRDRILHVLSGAPIPMDVENVRIKSGLKNWESTKALLLELVVEGIISGQKTTKSWVFWIDHTDTRMSTRLNSSHPSTSYAVFCLKKKNQMTNQR